MLPMDYHFPTGVGNCKTTSCSSLHNKQLWECGSVEVKSGEAEVNPEELPSLPLRNLGARGKAEKVTARHPHLNFVHRRSRDCFSLPLVACSLFESPAEAEISILLSHIHAQGIRATRCHWIEIWPTASCCRWQWSAAGQHAHDRRCSWGLEYGGGVS